MATEFNTRIKFKRDTSANWTNKNPIILNGEIILVDTDTGELRAKVGDGVKSYTQLPFSDEVIRSLVTEHNVSETAHENMGWITSDSGLPSDPALINADTLGGIPASEYAKETDIPTQLSQLSSDATHRTVTDIEKNSWNDKVGKLIPSSAGNVALLNSSGNLQDSGKGIDDFGTQLVAQTITLTTSGWTQGSDNRYYQTKSVSGVTSSTPVVWVDCDLSTSDVDAKVEILTAWAGPSANEVKQGSGTLTFYSYEVPTINIPVNVGVG